MQKLDQLIKMEFIYYFLPQHHSHLVKEKGSKPWVFTILMCSLLILFFRFFSYALFAWIILSWVQVSPEHPLGQVKYVLDKGFTRILEPIRSRIPTLRIGMAGLDLSPLVLIFGVNLLQPYLLRAVC